MVSTDEKREVIKMLIEQFGKTRQVEEVQMKLHELLLRDTDNGKLYKYRSFDSKGNSLENLQNGTLYCSRPNAFNDPFDCKIGITFNSLCTELYSSQFDLITNVFEKFTKVLDDEIEIEDCPVEEQRILKKLFTNNRVMACVMDNRHKAASEEEREMLLIENAYIVEEMLQIIFGDETFAGELSICADMIPQIFKNITPEGIVLISREGANYEDFARANGITDDADEIALTMRMSEKITSEFACVREDNFKYIDEMEQEMNEKMGSMFLVGCLCTDCKNRLMWSHYADGHTGFCVEYDFSGADASAFAMLPFPVFYSENRPIIPWKAAIDDSAENIAEAAVELMLGVLTKDKAWEYENEWRILLGANESPDLHMPRITCIYLGVDISEENRIKILEIAAEKDIPVKQMIVDRGAYALHAEDVSIEKKIKKEEIK